MNDTTTRSVLASKRTRGPPAYHALKKRSMREDVTTSFSVRTTALVCNLDMVFRCSFVLSGAGAHLGARPILTGPGGENVGIVSWSTRRCSAGDGSVSDGLSPRALPPPPLRLLLGPS